MDIKFAHALIERPESASEALFENAYPGVFWVDWREGHDDIVAMVADVLGEPMPIAWQDDRLQIEFRGTRVEAPLTGAPGEQDRTLGALNLLISRDHELRFVAASEGGDTLAFIVLTKRQWAGLVRKHGKSAVDDAFPKLDPQRPRFGDGGDTSGGEALEAPVDAANPGRLGAFKLGRAAIRVINAEQAEAWRRRHAETPDDMPVMRPFCGDLVLSYVNDLLDSRPPITEGERRACDLGHDALHALAEAHCHTLWEGFRILRAPGVDLLYTAKPIDNSSFACFGSLWNVMGSEGVPVVAAFSSRDAVVYANEGDADGIAFLIASIDAAQRDPATALSRELFLRVDERWQVRPYRGTERRAVPESLQRAIEARDYNTQCAWANLMQRVGMADQAAELYRRAGAEAEVARIDSPDMFVNGSALLCNLADLYEHGLGVAQDFHEAQAWYRRAAAMKNFVAEYSLGHLYLKGQGVAQDVEQARYWFTRSAQQGYADAKKALEAL
jgi:hypothetical protein